VAGRLQTMPTTPEHSRTLNWPDVW
jgi:hypothetical protein